MDKWSEYKSFNNYKKQNKSQLINEYNKGKNCGDSMRSTDDISFEDFCLGVWQRIN